MIEYRSGDIFSGDTEAWVNPVNCVGVMGKGLALQFKSKFPANYISYYEACQKQEVKPGKMFVYETQGLNPKYIINFPTKRHWKEKSYFWDIESGMKNLVDLIINKKIQSISIPPIGCGLGGLNWVDVKRVIINNTSKIKNVRVVLYESL